MNLVNNDKGEHNMLGHSAGAVESKGELQSHGISHHVFISHRGTDKRTVAFPLMALFGIFCHERFAFFDQTSIGIGEPNETVLQTGIDSSETCLAVIGNDFFTSKWCVWEVEQFLKRPLRGSKLAVIPLFAGLSPERCRVLTETDCLDKSGEILTEHELAKRKAIAKTLGRCSGYSQSADKSTKAFVLDVMEEFLRMGLPTKDKDARIQVRAPDFDGALDDLRDKLDDAYERAVAFFDSHAMKLNAGLFRGFLAEIKRVLIQRHSGPEQNKEQLAQLQARILQVLKNSYVGYNTIKGLFGKPLQLEGQYINLQMLYKIELSERDEKNKLPTYQDHRISSFEDLFGDKRAIKPLDVFKPDKDLFPEELLKHYKNTDKIPHFLLIQGRAGIGKTTFVRYSVREWAKGNLFSEFTWVFCIAFRELRNHVFTKAYADGKQFSLAEWIYHSQFKNIPEADFQLVWQKCIEPLIREGKVLFFFDGYDEMPIHHACESAMQTLLEGEYAIASKLITSRPYGVGNLSALRRNIEILGFTDENIEQYIKTYFADRPPEFTHQLIASLREHTTLWGSAHIPVNVNLICGIHDRQGKQLELKDTPLLNSMTDLYQAMDVKLLERAYLTRDQQQTLPESLNRRQTFLRCHYQTERNFLSRLAFQGLQIQRVILERPLIDKLLDEQKISDDTQFMQSLKNIGLLKPIVESDMTESECSYEFIHLTFQEYYAAVYVAEALLHPSLSFEITTTILKEKCNPRWQIVWWLVAGLIKEESKVLEQYLQLLQGHRDTLVTNDLFGHYEIGLLARCLDEAETPINQGLLRPIVVRIQNMLRQYYEISTYTLVKEKSFDLFASSLLTSLHLSQRLFRKKEQDDIAVLIPTEAEHTKEFREFVRQTRLATPKTLSHLATLLGSGEADSEDIKTIEKLGALAATPEFLSRLSELLGDEKDDGVRHMVSWAIGALGAAAATPEILMRLLAFLGDEHRHLKTQGFEGINAVNTAAEALGNLGAAAVTPEILARLTTLLDDEKDDDRYAAAQAIGYLGRIAATPEILARLANLLAHKNWDIRQAALWSVGHLGAFAATPEILARLPNLLDDEVRGVRWVAVHYAVGELGAAAATPEILSRLATFLGYGYNEGAEAMGNLGTSSMRSPPPHMQQFIVNPMGDMNWGLRGAVAGAIGKLGAAAAIPELLSSLATLLGNEKGNIRHFATQAVNGLGIAAATPEFLARLTIMRLGDSRAYVRKNVTEILEKFGVGVDAATPAILRQLIALLGDKDSYIRGVAAQAVGGLGATAATPEIILCLSTLLHDENWEVRQFAAHAVGELGVAAATPEILPQLATLLGDEENWNVRHGAAWAIEKLGTQVATPEILAGLITLLRDENMYVHYTAARAIGELGVFAATPEFLSRLTPLLGDENWNVRDAAAIAVGSLGAKTPTPEFLSCLITLLDHEKWEIRQAVTKAVGKFGSKTAMPEFLSRLTKLLSDEKDDVRDAATEAVGEFGAEAATPEILSRLTTLLGDQNWNIRQSAATAVRKLGVAAATPEILPQLAALVGDEQRHLKVHHSVSLVAARAIVELRVATATPEFLSHLVVLLSDEERSIRYVAAEVIGEIGAAAATPELLSCVAKLLGDKNGEIREAVVSATLKKLGAHGAIPEILSQLAVLLGDAQDDIREAAGEAVGNLGAAAATAEILPRLTVLLGDAKREVRLAAAKAVNTLGIAAMPEILSRLAILLCDEDDFCRQPVEEAIDKLGSTAATPEFLLQLATFLGNEKDSVRKSATEAVGKLGTAAATPEILLRLATLLSDEQDDVRQAAAEAVDKLGTAAATPEFLSHLAILLSKDNKEIFRTVISILSKFPFSTIKTHLSDWANLTQQEGLLSPHVEILIAVIVNLYLNGKINLQIMPQAEDRYLVYGFADKEPYEIFFSQSQAQYLRSLIPIIIEQLCQGKIDLVVLLALRPQDAATIALPLPNQSIPTNSDGDAKIEATPSWIKTPAATPIAFSTAPVILLAEMSPRSANIRNDSVEAKVAEKPASCCTLL